MSPRLSRRHWVLFMGAAPLLARQAPSQPSTPEQRTEKAKAGVREVSDKLAGLEVPMNVEPSFRFVA